MKLSWRIYTAIGKVLAFILPGKDLKLAVVCALDNHKDIYTYDTCGASYEEIDKLHLLLHPQSFGGLCNPYAKPPRYGQCDKFWCLNYVPELAHVLKRLKLKVVPE